MAACRADDTLRGCAVGEGFTAFHPRGTRLAAYLKMAGDPPAAQVSKEARGFKDNNDHKDFKDARKRDKGTEGT